MINITDRNLIAGTFNQAVYGNNNPNGPTHVSFEDFITLFNPNIEPAVAEAQAQEILTRIQAFEINNPIPQNNPLGPLDRYDFTENCQDAEVVRNVSDLISSRNKVLKKIFDRAKEQSTDGVIDILDRPEIANQNIFRKTYLSICDIGTTILNDELSANFIKTITAVATFIVVANIMTYALTASALLAGKVATLSSRLVSPSILAALGQISSFFASIKAEEIGAFWAISLLAMMFNNTALHVPYLNETVAVCNAVLALCVWDLMAPVIVILEGGTLAYKSFVAVESLNRFFIAEARTIRETELAEKKQRISREWQRLIDEYAPRGEERQDSLGGDETTDWNRL